MTRLDSLAENGEWEELSGQVTDFFGLKKQELSLDDEELVHYWCGYNLTQKAFEVKIIRRPIEGPLNKYIKSEEGAQELREIISNGSDRYLITYQLPRESDQDNVRVLKKNF